MIVSPTKAVTIIDIGLGNVYSRDTLLTTFCGTPAYAAPELWKSQPYDGGAADMWALGVIFYVISTGLIPFEDVASVCSCKFDKTCLRSLAARDLATRLIRVNVAERLTAAQACRHPFICGLGGTPCTYQLDPHPQPPRADLLQQMPTYGFSEQETAADLAADRRNQRTTTYHLASKEPLHSDL